MLALLNEGRADPSLTDVAARTGMSPDAVFGYFDGAEDLRAELIDLHVRRVQALLTAAGQDGTTEDRIRRYVDARLEFCATMAGTGRVAHTRAQVPEIAAGVERIRDLWRAHTRTQFAPELALHAPAAADEVVETVESQFRFDAWDELVSVQGRSTEQIRRAWMRLLQSQLAADPVAGS